VLIALKQPLEVEQVGGPSLPWDLLGPAAIVLAAFIGAVAAAWYASRNVRKELNAADLRLRRQLKHDQEMRSREAIRRTLDQVTDVLTEAMDALADFVGEVVSCGEHARDADAAVGGSKEQQEARRALTESMEAVTRSMTTTQGKVMKLSAARLRLRLRFEETDPVYRNFDLTCDAVLASYEREVEASGRARSDDELTEATGGRMEVARRLRLYTDAVRDWQSSVIEPENLDT
jgi:hypothetical protein